jgi:protein-disulfide isomerase
VNSKVLVITTLIVLALISFAGLHFNSTKRLPPGITLETDGQPTIGYPKAKVHVVVFEEPKCTDCKTYSDTIFPKIKKDFIDTNKIKYTLIPVSFIPDSMPAAIAWLSVYNQDPEFPNKDLFYNYVEYMFAHQPSENEDWATIDNLLKFAKETSPAIKLDVLKNNINREAYRIQIEKNTKYGFSIMNHVLATPSIYVEGIKVEDINYPDIKHLINTVIQQKGDHRE